MHKQLLHDVIASVRRRIAQGDSPTEQPFTREMLENAVDDLATQLSEQERYREALEYIARAGSHGASYVARGALSPETRGGGLVTPAADKPPAE